MSSNPKDKEADEDGLFDEDDDDDSSDEDIIVKSKKRKAEASTTKKKKKSKPSWIDDAAEESGEEGGGDDEDDDDEDDDKPNEYVKDGFVVDEADVEDELRASKKKSKGALEDSDDEDDDDDDEDDDSPGPKKTKKAKKVRKLRDVDRLADEDLDLIREARGELTEAEIIQREREAAAKRKVVAQNEAELRKGLFYDSGDEDGGEPSANKPQQRRVVERYDEDGMDDFIDDDIGDQGAILASERRAAYDEEGGAGVSEAQLNEASEIFGTDYLEFMAQEDDANQDEEELFGKGRYRERGVGVDLGVDSDADDISEDEESEEEEDDLFGEDGDGVQAVQKAEAMKLRREKRELARQERRNKKKQEKSAKRKAKLRRNFEPVQLVENFCTDRDDEIRQRDAPERFFEWKTPFHGNSGSDVDDHVITDEEEEEALWIMGRIPEIAAEYFAPTAEPNQTLEDMEAREKSIISSIVHALRFLHLDKLEPAFIKRYRKDVVTSPAVRNNLYQIQDEDGEWDTLVGARAKVGDLLDNINRDVQGVEASGAEVDSLKRLEQELATAQEKLDETALQESEVKGEVEKLGAEDEHKDDDDDDDDELFGDDDDDQKGVKEKKESLQKHLSTIQALLQDRAEKVTQLETATQNARARNSETNRDQGPALRVIKKVCRENLWNAEDMVEYISGLTDVRHILDASVYLNLIKEGNDAVRKKELRALSGDGKNGEGQRRSRRFDRDFYRTCVSEGHRDIAYRFLLSPNRVGVKLEDTATSDSHSFDFTKTMPGEDAPRPQNWVPPTIPMQSPGEFAGDLVGSGELVLLSSTSGMDPDDQEAKDPFRGCRYVAAMELAHEPRIRRHLRNIYRRHSALTTRPTKKGMEAIDSFHEYYGLHLIKNKPIKEHFPMDEKESAERKANLGPAECQELDAEMKRRQNDSCMQYLNLLKAERTGHVSVHVHLPLIDNLEDWYSSDDLFSSRDKQDLNVLLSELERVYYPLDADSDEWNDERKKVLNQALVTFLLPQFEMETRRELKEAAIKVGLESAGESLYNMAMEGPYRPPFLNHTENRFLHPTGDLPIVGICCSTDSREASYLAFVSEHGELSDHVAIPGGARVDNGKYREKVITFLLQSRPAAVLVGTSGGFESRIVARKMNDIVAEAMQRWNSRGIQAEDEDDEDFEKRQDAFRAMMPRGQYIDDDDEDLDWKCNVDLIDDSVSQLFGRSVRGKKEFPDNATNLKIATSIARYGKDPLVELTYAWSVASDTGNFGSELFFINIHPMQQLLPKMPLLRYYERALCEVVAAVGVDLNRACKHEHLLGLLSFVPGLGPRKAANLKQSIEQMGGIIGTRRSLLEKRLMGPVVYNNSVAFLRIQDLDDQLLHPLDNTRLHPDVYHRNNWAVKIATDALERAEENREKAGIKALLDVMDNSSQELERLYNATKDEWVARYGPTFNVAEWDPNPGKSVRSEHWRDKVEELDLDTFADMIEQNGFGRWQSHLEMIKWEFRLPFADPRNPMEPLMGDKLFKLITGETDQTLRPGKEVTGKVVRNGDFGSRVKLEGDIPAFIPLRNLSDEHVETAEDVVTVGMVVTAVITEVKVDHLCVDMSLKMEDFKRPPSSWDRPASLPPIDDHFDRTSSLNIEEKKSKDREARLEAMQLTLSATKIGIDGDESSKKRMGRVARRACAHPAFRNARNDEVDKELKAAGPAMVGEALIRPSSKSADSLAIHWVVKEDSIKVVEVREEDKDTDASIGNILRIKDETYGSIDEMLGRYIAPMNDYVEELTNHRKFLELAEDEVDDNLRKQKTANPATIPYNICWMEMHAGYASLRFITSTTPRHHPIGISPNGFVWGSKVYNNLDRLLNEFKKNPRGVSASQRSAPKPPSAPPAESVAPKPSRWGNKPAAPPAPAAWGQQPQPPPQPAGGWAAAASAGYRPPPPDMPPPPSGYGRPQPPNQPPPPSFARPPPPGPPPGYQQNSSQAYGGYQQPPPPPGYPPRV